MRMSVTLVCVVLAVSLSALAKSPTPTPTPTPRAILEDLAAVATPHQLTVNGFPTDKLNSMYSDLNGSVDGFAPPIERYAFLHPYFLKPGDNAVTATYQFNSSMVAASDKGPWSLRLRVGRFLPVKKDGGLYDVTTLLDLTSPPLKDEPASKAPHTVSGHFTWKEALPLWRWTHGEKISPDAKTKESLHAQLTAFYERLQGLYEPGSKKPSAPALAFREETRGSIREFIQASEVQGRKFTYLDHFFDLCRWRAEGPPAAAPAAKKTPRAKPKTTTPPVPVAVLDGPSGNEGKPLRYLPDGGLPTEMDLRALPALKDTELHVFAGGTLAELTDHDGGPLLVFDRNYQGGSWGNGNEPLDEASVWFRKSAQGQWELDALVPRHLAGMEIMNGSLSDLIQVQGY